MRLNDFRIAPHFSLREFECPCCHHVRLHPRLVDLLERLRGEAGGVPLVVNSGFRCSGHNRAVGGVPTSLHRFGLAADVAVGAGRQAFFAECARGLGFDEVIEYRARGFVHVGLRAS